MARLTIEDCWWTDPRRERLGELMGGMVQADAAAIRMWRLAQEYWGRGRKLIPQEIFETLEAAPKLIQAGLASPREGGIYVRGSNAYIDWLNEKRAAAKRGGQTSAKRPRNAKGQLTKTSKQKPSETQLTSNTLQPSGSGSVFGSVFGSGFDSGAGSGEKVSDGLPAPSPTAIAWAAYTEAYQAKYKQPPVRNATTNSQMKNFVGRLGSEAAEVLRFYLKHPNAYYKNKGHSLGVALVDAEKLRTEWASGRVQTTVQSRQEEQLEATLSQLERIDRGLV